jgi:deoxycytidylate deaminase
MIAYVFEMMQRAVDIVQTSPHPTNKIAASLARKQPGKGWEMISASTNLWPKPILEAFGPDTDIGNASGTIHAEIACVLSAPITKNTHIFITDPPCPNCVKALAESGIRRIYIDHKGFGKDFAQRRGQDFENISLPLCLEAGIGVFEVRRKDKTIRCLQKGRTTPQARRKNSILIESCSLAEIRDFCTGAHRRLAGHPFAAGLCKTSNNATDAIAVTALDFENFAGDPWRGKYTATLEPLTRLLMVARRKGWALIPRTIHTSRIPTAREMVNFLGGGLEHIHIGDQNAARDIFGPIALKQLTDHKIITVIEEL